MHEMAYRDPALPVEDRVNDLLHRMSAEEKAGQLTQFFYFGSFTAVPDDFDLESLPPEHRAFVEQPAMVRQAVRDGRAGSLLFVKDAAVANQMQRIAMDETPLGIPLIFGYDVIHGFRTIFPAPIGIAASWDPQLAEDAQSVAAREARAAGIHWTFAPMVDITRDGRWGRIFEGAGEDPCLGSAMAAAQVRGFQGDLGRESLIAGPKHFAGYGASAGGRDYDDADISDAELHNVYLPPFRAAIDAGAGNVMSAYMDLNGVPASGNRWLLTDVLRDQYGFDGWVVSDANAVRSLETQHFAKDLTDAGARALGAGLDMEMCMFEPAYANLPSALEQGLVTKDALDQAVHRVLTAKFRMGLFENPWADEEQAPPVLGRDDHREASRTAAERATVLLKNSGVLPLADGGQRIGVFGHLADSRRDTLGPWVFAHDLDETVTILAGLRARAGDVEVEFVPATAVPQRLSPSIFDQQETTPLPATPADFDAATERARAVETAKTCDVAVVVLGQPQNMIGENASVSTLDLPEDQIELLKAIHATGTPTVAVVMTGRPVDLRWAQHNVEAIVQVWYPGTRGGEAVARVLFGDVSPAGRLPFTWPRHVGHVPIHYAHHRTFAPQDQDKRYWDEPSTPLYPFGHGLSYSSFEYGDLEVPENLGVGETGEVRFTVTNTGESTSDEVVQLYIHQRHGTSSRPVRALKGFQRLHLGPGESRQVTLELGPEQLRYWSAVTRDWIQDATVLDVWVGGDSTAELTATVTVTA
ncbi:glycoside hydrolase family 3 N-terminal domain-containing protein [Tessaracoccus rhinocerotis]|nr:glycoside hydrolase family 3 N-terminal domain-containing protein [Tessaracoccus rhinocerotis]